jgi:hypothetical protein
MLRFSVPPSYRRSKPPARAKLDAFTGVIDRILEEDQGRPAKQRHTVKRIFERLRDENSYAGGLTIVKRYQKPRFLPYLTFNHGRFLLRSNTVGELCSSIGHTRFA